MPQHDLFHLSHNAPKAMIMSPVEAERGIGANEAFFWGCPVTNLKATLPIHGMREAFAVL